MWNVDTNNKLRMAEGDFGIDLPITVNGAEIDSGDSIKITIKKKLNGDLVLEKEYTDIEDNTINLSFTEAESELLTVGGYVYSLDWFKDGEFQCNIILNAILRVEDKA